MAEAAQPYKKYSDALLTIVKSYALDGSDAQRAYRQITKTAATTLNVERASVWMYDDDDRAGVRCLTLYENQSDLFSVGGTLRRSDYPLYFDALEMDRVVDAHNANTDIRTIELAETYSDGLGIASILDAPTRLNGNLIGIMCIEHVGTPRYWTTEEVAFVGSLSDILAHAVDACNRVLIEQELGKIESRQARSARITKLGHWEWDAQTDSLTYCSSELAKIFGFTVEEMLEKTSSMADNIQLVAPEDRDRYKKSQKDSMINGEDYEIEFLGLVSDGSVKTLIERFELVIDDDGTVLGAFGTTQDITEHSQQLQKAHDNLERIVEERTLSLTKEIEARKQAEEEAKINEARLQAILENLPVEVVLKDVKGRYLYANPVFEERFGISRESILGRTVHGVDVEEELDVSEITEQDRNVLASGISYANEETYVAKDGTAGAEIVTKFPVIDVDGNNVGIGTIAQDVSELKRIEGALRRSHDELEMRIEQRTRELKESEGFLSRATDIAHIGYWVWDDIEKRVVRCSDECARIYGISVEEYLRYPHSTTEGQKSIHPNDLERWRMENQVFESTLQRFDVEYRVVTPQGETRWVHEIAEPILDAKGTHVQTHGVIQDITKQKTVENNLRHQSLAIEQVEHTVKYGHWTWDEVHSTMLYCSAGLPRIHGMTTEEYLDAAAKPDPIPQLIHPDDVGLVEKYLIQTKGSGEMHWIEYRFVHPKDGVRWVREVGKPMDISDAGEVLTSVGGTYDVTEQKRLEQLKNEFISTVSHELRTPLTSIVGSLGLAKSGQFGEVLPKIQHMLDIAYDNSTRLAQLTNDILDMDKIMSDGLSLNIAPTNVVSMVHEALSLNKGYGDLLKVTFNATMLDDEVTVNGDKDRIVQVLSNLMSNAAKFSAKGDVVEICMVREEGNVRIAVMDVGCGVPEEFGDTTFDRFTQVDASDKRKMSGSGLGLSISKSIVELHGGTIGYESQVGVGSEFYFLIPVFE